MIEITTSGELTCCVQALGDHRKHVADVLDGEALQHMTT